MIHNDFRLDNLVLAADDPLRVVGVLDWEMATLGDPLMDLGGALAYWVQADDDRGLPRCRRQPYAPARDADPRRGRRARTPRAPASSVTPEQWRFYEVFGLFRLGRDRPADLLPLPPRADHQRGLRPVPADGAATSSSAATG